MEEEPLSLANFDPSRSQAPYLNSPRSLEACRRHGVKPVELVEISIDEFRKDFPNEPDVAQRRFDRIDGARRRILQYVYDEWYKLVQTNWTADSKVRPQTSETVIPVPPEANCELLELQAAQFRKLERNQMKLFQKMLKLELTSVVEEMHHKKIIEKEEARQAVLDNKQKEQEQVRFAMQKEYIQEKRKRDEEFEEQLKIAKARALEEAMEKRDREEQQQMLERTNRMKRESLRVENEAYIRGKKNYILNRLSSDLEQKRIVKEKRDERNEQRVLVARENKSQQMALKREELEQRLQKAQDDKAKSDEEKRLKLLRQAEEKEEKLRKAQLQKKKQHLERTQDVVSFEKMKAIRDAKDQLAAERIEKIQNEIDFKEYLTKKELQRIQDMQEKRRTIKTIRQEAFQLAHKRQQKVDDFNRSRRELDLKMKQERSEAIRQGERVLSQVRSDVKHVMMQTKLELRKEVAKLMRKDEYSPEKVYSKAVEVTENVLLPSLERNFSRGSSAPRATSSEFKSRVATSSGSPYGGTFMSEAGISMDQGRDLSKSANDLPTLKRPSSSKAAPRASTALDGSDRKSKRVTTARSTSPGRSPSRGRLISEPRKPTTLLPLKTLTREKLMSLLEVSKFTIVNDGTEEVDPALAGLTPYDLASGKELPMDTTGAQLLASAGGTGEQATDGEVSARKEPYEDIDDGVDLFPLYSYTFPLDDDMPAERPKLPEEPRPASETIRTEAKTTISAAQTAATTSTKQASSTSKKEVFLPSGKGEFRREMSADHPLVGGSGKYSKEKAKGLRPAGIPKGLLTQPEISADEKVQRLTVAASALVVDPQKQLEKLRKEHNETLIRVLEEERRAEEDRVRALKEVGEDDGQQNNERSQLLLLFAEERRRASDRIIQLTKQHENQIRNAVVSMVSRSE